MTTAIAERAPDAPTVTSDQLALITRTVAKDATPDELKLYLFDCQRQGVHPLDKLIHFTVRKDKDGTRKYTPVTSIDFMRIRAADSGEYAGSDDATFDSELLSNGAPDHVKPPRAAHVTVWRLVQGQRCSFTATARWAEYKPEFNDFMWRKMPHTMLAKCAEALALRKGFPRQLAGLYAKEELDQAEKPIGYSVQAPTPSLGSGGVEREKPAARTVEAPSTFPTPAQMQAQMDAPEGAVFIERIDVTATKNPNVKRALITVSSGEQFATINAKLAALAEQIAQERTPCFVESKPTKWGPELVSLRVERELTREEHTPASERLEPLLDSEIPF